VNPAKVGLAVQGGLSVVCATCVMYWRARDVGLPEPACLAKDGCGSPLKGGDFHEYSGPMTDFGRWCFVCGTDAAYGIRVQGKTRTIGMCGDHLRYLTELRPVDAVDFLLQGELRSDSTTVPIERLRLPKKKTLGQVIYEVESYFAEKSGRGTE
jgi:hypothetical protein